MGLRGWAGITPVDALICKNASSGYSPRARKTPDLAARNHPAIRFDDVVVRIDSLCLRPDDERGGGWFIDWGPADAVLPVHPDHRYLLFSDDPAAAAEAEGAAETAFRTAARGQCHYFGRHHR